MIGRNANCPCNSGKRYKHCCGLIVSGHDSHGHITDIDIEIAISEADDFGLNNGEDPKGRAFHNILRALTSLNVNNVVLMGASSPPIVKRIRAANAKLFRPKDSQEGGIHLGMIMYRDIFAQFSVPLIFGSPEIDLIGQTDFSDYQKIMLYKNPTEEARFLDQAIDLMDFGYGFMEFGHGRSIDSRGSDLIWRAHSQLEAAAATATNAYDYRGTLQSSLLGAELALKAGLAASGISDDDLKNPKKFGHNLEKSAKALSQKYPDFDHKRVIRMIQGFPNFVQSRYNTTPPTRIKTGEILMGAQYIASEVTRLFSDRNLRRDDPTQPPRSYPQ